MSDAPLRGYGGHEWFWEPGDENLIYPLDNLVEMYLKSVGRNSTLILGIAPDTSGLIPDADGSRLADFGKRIGSMFSDPIASRSGRGSQLNLNLKGDSEISTIIIQEEIVKGERVRQYIIDGRTSMGWKTIATGSCIGHKRIETIEPITVSGIRLRITEAIDHPIIKNLAVY